MKRFATKVFTTTTHRKIESLFKLKEVKDVSLSRGTKVIGRQYNAEHVDGRVPVEPATATTFYYAITTPGKNPIVLSELKKTGLYPKGVREDGSLVFFPRKEELTPTTTYKPVEEEKTTAVSLKK